MEQLLAKRLYEFILLNNPDLLIRENEKGINQIISDKIKNVVPVLENLLVQNCPAYIIEELCMDQMTEDLKPSKYHYIARVLEEEFPDRYSSMREAGILTYEIAGIIDHCDSVFDHFQFSRFTEEDRKLYYVVTGAIGSYFSETVNIPSRGL
jgi:hypothetical protein